MAPDQPPGALPSEVERVRAAYARRPPASEDPRYSWLQAGHLFLMQERERAVLRAFVRHGLNLAELRILEVGCGNANWLRDLLRWGGSPERLFGVDLLFARLREGRRRGPPGAGLACASAEALPFASRTFDLVLQSTVFTSVLDQPTRGRMAAEMLRVVRPGGRVLWYDYHVNNPSNPDVRGVTRGEIARLFPGCRIDLERVTLAPPIARRLARFSWLLCTLLEYLPLLRTHYLAVISPPQPAPPLRA